MKGGSGFVLDGPGVNSVVVAVEGVLSAYSGSRQLVIQQRSVRFEFEISCLAGHRFTLDLSLRARSAAVRFVSFRFVSFVFVSDLEMRRGCHIWSHCTSTR